MRELSKITVMQVNAEKNEPEQKEQFIMKRK